MSAVTTTTEATFEADVLNADQPVLVDFWAEWCGPCRAIAPVLEELAADYPKLKVAKLNVDENPNLAMEHRITSIPALKVFVNGEVVETIIGAQPKQAFEKALAAYLA